MLRRPVISGRGLLFATFYARVHVVLNIVLSLGFVLDVDDRQMLKTGDQRNTWTFCCPSKSMLNNDQ